LITILIFRPFTGKHFFFAGNRLYIYHISKEATLMDLTYDYISKWFDAYFEDVRRYQGDLETVSNLKKYFIEDFELTMHTASSSPLRMSRDALLMSFVHPGLQEDITPRHYAVDMKQMIVAVQFEINFSDKPSGKKWPPLQASAHYQLIVDEDKDLRIKRIDYWTQILPADLFEFWAKRRDEAMAKHALGYINAAQ
jgi:hypothetical protein